MGSEARLAHRSRLLVSIQGDVAVAYCIGTLDRSVVEDLSERARALTFDGVRGLVCSLERVSHIHFQALDSILALSELMKAAGGRFLMAGASSYLRQILDFGGVPASVPLLADSNEAVESLLAKASVTSEFQDAGLQQSIF